MQFVTSDSTRIREFVIDRRFPREILPRLPSAFQTDGRLLIGGYIREAKTPVSGYNFLLKIMTAYNCDLQVREIKKLQPHLNLRKNPVYVFTFLFFRLEPTFKNRQIDIQKVSLSEIKSKSNFVVNSILGEHRTSQIIMLKSTMIDPFSAARKERRKNTWARKKEKKRSHR